MATTDDPVVVDTVAAGANELPECEYAVNERRVRTHVCEASSHAVSAAWTPHGYCFGLRFASFILVSRLAIRAERP